MKNRYSLAVTIGFTLGLLLVAVTAFAQTTVVALPSSNFVQPTQECTQNCGSPKHTIKHLTDQLTVSVGAGMDHELTENDISGQYGGLHADSHRSLLKAVDASYRINNT